MGTSEGSARRLPRFSLNHPVASRRANVVHFQPLRRRNEMSDVQKIQMVILMPPSLADACAKIAAEKLTSRSTWVRQLIAAAIKKESSQDAA
jgi:hypothetical protein